MIIYFSISRFKDVRRLMCKKKKMYGNEMVEEKTEEDLHLVINGEGKKPCSKQ